MGLGDGEQGGVELDEGGVDGGVLVVAGIAGGGGGRHFGGEDGPSFRRG